VKFLKNTRLRCHVVYTLVHLDTHSEPNPVNDVQPVKLMLPELPQLSIVLAGVGDNLILLLLLLLLLTTNYY